MDIEQLKTFLEVDRMRNFRKAAENLFISPSAVSARVRQLEDTLGLSLFRRDRQKVSLTPAGERFERHARFIVGAWERAHEEVALSDQVDKRLVIGGLSSLWEIYLQGWLNGIHCSAPLIGLRAEAGTSKRIVQKLEQGIIDLGFLFEPPRLRDMVVQEVRDVSMIMVSTEQDIPVDRALAEGYVRVDWGTSFTSLHESHFPQRPIAAVRANVGSIALGLIENCGGAAYLPATLVEADIAMGKLWRVPDAPEILLKSYAVFPIHGEHRSLIDQLLERLQPDMGGAG
ncbi:LysR family transcriptional regulator [Thiogranum longum]|uniref:LysR family transcriptional regulator n=1 Tax=Thiogranum longum TaxID=1537524 RepID=A0A4R1HDU8_9GAMM|nr:LysR family transcriptional regulator [Thiogranum longum]TCK18340.1 LysR family transcriptional regulator [Thiogranum longum]